VPRPVESVWKDKLYIGKVTLLCGNPGLGKSFVSTDLAARTTNGSGWPDSPHEKHKPRGVVMINGEDDNEDTTVPRLIAHHADLSRIVTLDGLKDTEDGSAAPFAIDLSCHLDYVRAAIDQVDNAGLLIVERCVRGRLDRLLKRVVGPTGFFYAHLSRRTVDHAAAIATAEPPHTPAPAAGGFISILRSGIRRCHA
jgi:hypothetical protein